MSKKRLLPVLAVAVVAAAAAVWLAWPEGEAAGTVSFSGNIEMTQVEISFKTPGRIVELAVEEGDDVKRDAVLARLDDEQLRSRRQQAVASLEASQSRLQELLARIRFQEESMEGQIEQRRAEVRQAEARLRELRAGSRTQEIEQARAAVRRAESQYEKAAADWRRAEELFADEDISQIQHDQYRTAHESALATLRQVKEQLALVVEGPRAEDVEAAEAQVARAKAGLRLAQSLSLEVESARLSAGTVRAEIEGARAQVAELDTQLEDTVAVSPIDGVVLSKNAESGEVVAAGTSLLSLGDVGRPWLRGYIPEDSLGRVKLGSPVRVTTDSYPDKEYTGTVTFISSEAEFTPKQIQTPQERVKLVYRIKVTLENPNRELKLNMPCDARIEGL